MQRIFLSHAHQDKDVARQISVALKEAGIEPWLDESELRPGDELLKTIARVINEVDYFAVLLTPTALTKAWVLTEMRMAMTSEIERHRPRVVVLLLKDCEVPVELRHKLHLDFRGRFSQALGELRNHLLGVEREIPRPKQAIIADMVQEASPELWKWLSRGTDEWSHSDVANLLRELRSDQLEAAVAIGHRWKGDQKMGESDLADITKKKVRVSEALARRLVRDLVNWGFFEEAHDLDYRMQPEQDYYAGILLRIVYRSARRSGLFSDLPLPVPERLSAFLASDQHLVITGRGWYGIRYPQPVQSTLDASHQIVAAVQNYSPPRVWAFRSSDDDDPLIVDKRFALHELTADDASTGLPKSNTEMAGFDLRSFDDLGLLHNY
jgi:hypothetical protein